MSDPIIKGTIIKGIGGFYFVDTELGVFRAKGRGAIKKDGDLLTVGDIVGISIKEGDDSVIESLETRKNRFDRPPVSNVDKVVIVASAAKPETNTIIIDKLAVLAEIKGAVPIICISKTDAASESKIAYLREIYEPIYRTICISSFNGNGIDDLRSELYSCNTVFAGQSGVGKSTLINLLAPEAMMETGSISEKTKRGKHTTRHVEVFQCEGGRIFDTPGFSSINTDAVEYDQLKNMFPEMREAKSMCKFRDCMHINEPGCNVLEMRKSGLIHQSRYDSYIEILNEIKRRRK